MKAFLSNSFFALHNTSVTTFFYIIFLFISFGLCWVFVAAQAFSLVADSRGQLSSCDAGASHGRGFCCRAPALGRVGFSSCGSQPLEHRLSSCGARA